MRLRLSLSLGFSYKGSRSRAIKVRLKFSRRSPTTMRLFFLFFLLLASFVGTLREFFRAVSFLLWLDRAHFSSLIRSLIRFLVISFPFTLRPFYLLCTAVELCWELWKEKREWCSNKLKPCEPDDRLNVGYVLQTKNDWYFTQPSRFIERITFYKYLPMT